MVTTLFDTNESIGVFKGFVEGGMEFHADLVLPYKKNMTNRPMHGMYLLIQLENPYEAVLGRITSVASQGKLMTSAGEDYTIRAAESQFAVPEDLKEQYLKYNVNVRVLGGLKIDDGRVVFVPSFRRIPSVGSPVCFPSDEVLKELSNSNSSGAPIGLYALGEYIFAGDKAAEYGLDQPWMNIQSPEALVRFDVNALVSRRTFVFARAGFGKSNLNKLLFSQLYKTIPMKKKGDRKVPVGTIIFDRDGEYFWPDDSGRPGLCDVDELSNSLVVFTNREPPNDYYGSFVAGAIKMDLRELPASVVISIAVSQDRQEQQNVRKLKSLTKDKWKTIIDMVYQDGYNSDIESVKSILGISEVGDAEAYAALSNITNVINMLHDPSSRFVDTILKALSDGRLCIVDLSQLSSEQALIMSGLVMNRIFDHNQREFTKADSKTIPTIVVLEEAQSVLTPGKNATTPFIAWVKEGRKYDLGALMITQQPGSISTDILSQGDNWFVFHLLSDKDLQDVKRANAHFSDDLLSSLLNEPIVGQGVFWSSVPIDNSPKPYPIPLRVLSFEHTVKIRDKSEEVVNPHNYVSALKKRMGAVNRPEVPNLPPEEEPRTYVPSHEDIMVGKAIEVLSANEDFLSNCRRGIPWGVISHKIMETMPEDEICRSDKAYKNVRTVLIKMFGQENKGWHLEKRMTSSGRMMTFVIVDDKE